MAARTLAEAQTELTAAYAARATVLAGGQSVAVDGQAVTFANLATLNELIDGLVAEVEGLTAAQSGSYQPFAYSVGGFRTAT